jgi:hypothetical protein
LTAAYGSLANATLVVVVLPRLHRVVLTFVAVVAATVACLLVGAATTDVVQCVWALAAGVSLAVAVLAWWPMSQIVSPRPPSAIDARTTVETDVDADRGVRRAA